MSEPFPSRIISRFVVRFVPVYFLLVFLQPSLDGIYSEYHRAFLRATIGGREFANFAYLVERPARESKGTEILISNVTLLNEDGTVNFGVVEVDEQRRHADYIHTAFLLALILASPVPLARKGWAILWGMILIHGFFLFKIGIYLFYLHCADPMLLMYDVTPFWKDFLFYSADTVEKNLTVGFVLAVPVWIAVTFRREDWAGVTQWRRTRELRGSL